MLGTATMLPQNLMKIRFTKSSGKFDFMEIIRHDGTLERVECPKQRIIPHDMVHYAVEHTLQTNGFLTRVKAGEVAGFQMKPESESDAVERLVEVLQGDEWSGGCSSTRDILDMYQVTCQARACVALPLDETTIQTVRAAIADLSTRWEMISIGGTLELKF